MSKNRLGKGLGALIGESSSEQSFDERITEIYIGDITSNPFQPRKKFDKTSLEELGQSIEENGIIQPITVRQVKPDLFQIVSGERRWRAFKIAGFKNIPAIVKDYTDRQMMEIALVENLQREDLNSIEKAQAYSKMIDEFNMTQAEVAQKVGKSRSAVANVVRLLKLSPKIQIYVSRGTISGGHARALLSLKDSQLQLKVLDVIVEKDFSVRKTEEYISQLLNKSNDKPEKPKKKETKQLDQRWIQAKNILSRSLGTDIKIKDKKKKKVITIECKDYNDMEKILNKIS